jgi:hypothetical protein
LVLHGFRNVQLAKLAIESSAPANEVDGPVSRRRDEPGGGIRRLALAWPTLRGDRESFLSGLLGEVEVAEEADEGRENATPLLAEGFLEDR